MDILTLVVAIVIALILVKLLTKLWKLWVAILIVVIAFALMNGDKERAVSTTKAVKPVYTIQTSSARQEAPLFKNGKYLCQRLRQMGVPVGAWKCSKNSPLCYCLSNYITFGGRSTIAYYVYGSPKGGVNRILTDVFIVKLNDWEEGYPLLVQGMRKILRILGIPPKKELFQAIYRRRKSTFILKPYKIQILPQQTKQGSAFKIVITYVKEG